MSDAIPCLPPTDDDPLAGAGFDWAGPVGEKIRPLLSILNAIPPPFPTTIDGPAALDDMDHFFTLANLSDFFEGEALPKEYQRLIRQRPLHPRLDDYLAIFRDIAREQPGWGEWDRKSLGKVRDRLCHVRSIGIPETGRIPLDEVIKLFPPCMSPSIGLSSSPPAMPSGSTQTPPTNPPPADEPPHADQSKPKGKKAKGVPLAEANIKVRDWLQENATNDPASITRDAVADGTRVSKGGVSKTSAWKTFRELRDAEVTPRVRKVRLTDTMQASVPANSVRCDELAATIKEQQQELADEARSHKRRGRPDPVKHSRSSS